MSTALVVGWLLIGAGVLAAVAVVVRGPDGVGRGPAVVFVVLSGLIGGLALQSEGVGVGAWVALGCLGVLVATFWWLPGA